MKKCLVTAHSGCMGTVPNSLEHIQKAIELKADIIEVDIRGTKDGIVVLSHDEQVSSCCSISGSGNGIGIIEELTYEGIRTIGGKLVTAEEILPLARENNFVFNLDLKDDEAVEPLMSWLKQLNMQDYVLLTGCGFSKAKAIKQHYGDFHVLLNAEETGALEEKDYGDYIKLTCNDALSAGCCGINISHEDCRRELMEYAVRVKLPVYVYTVDEADAMKKLMEEGAYSITTHKIDLLKALIR